MSQSYVPDGALVSCSEGKENSRIHVVSQTKTYMNGKLKATENDRFKGNFNCEKMTGGAASLGGMVGALVGALGGPVGGFVGFLAGRFAGGLLGSQSSRVLPSLCSTLCTSSHWTVVHPKVYIKGQQALLAKAQLSCKMGGLIQIILPDMDKALTHARLAREVYENIDYDHPENNQEIDGYKPVSAERAKEILGKDWKYFLNQDEDNGFYATLFEDKNGNVVVAYRGTDVGAGINDIKEDVVQALGISSDQYDASVDLAKQVKEAKNEGAITGEVSITGHSLGGGLATAAGSRTGYSTYTYNAAAVHDKTYERNQMEKNTNHIQSYIGTKDPLNAVQDNREIVLPGAVLLSPSLPVLGGIGGSVLGPIGSGIGGSIGTIGAGALTIGGTWGILSGGMPNQKGVQRIVVPQDCGFKEGHMIGDLITAMEKMQKSMGAGNPVIAANI